MPIKLIAKSIYYHDEASVGALLKSPGLGSKKFLFCSGNATNKTNSFVLYISDHEGKVNAYRYSYDPKSNSWQCPSVLFTRAFPPAEFREVAQLEKFLSALGYKGVAANVKLEKEQESIPKDSVSAMECKAEVKATYSAAALLAGSLVKAVGSSEKPKLEESVSSSASIAVPEDAAEIAALDEGYCC